MCCNYMYEINTFNIINSTLHILKTFLHKVYEDLSLKYKTNFAYMKINDTKIVLQFYEKKAKLYSRIRYTISHQDRN